jgi:hypothetical protein
MIHKQPSNDGDKVIVIFEIPGSVWADRIHLVGDFNNWDQESLPFHHNRRDDRQVRIELERGRQYRFRYLVDGVYWHNEWGADGHVPADDGAYDSVVIAQLTPAG